LNQPLGRRFAPGGGRGGSAAAAGAGGHRASAVQAAEPRGDLLLV